MPCGARRAGFLQDLVRFDVAAVSWSVPGEVHGPRPSARAFLGFAAGGGRFYVHGGCGSFDYTLGLNGSKKSRPPPPWKRPDNPGL